MDDPRDERNGLMPDPLEEMPRKRGPLMLLTVGVAMTVLAGAALGADLSGQPSAQASAQAAAERPNPAAVHDAALASGMPMFVFIHSSTCEPCKELAALAEVVMPEYEGRIAFVDALGSDSRSRPILDRYPGQYVPTSIFVDENGAVTETVIGTMTAEELRARLDVLVGSQPGMPFQEIEPAEVIEGIEGAGSDVAGAK